jgi:hypothetical protein
LPSQYNTNNPYVSLQSNNMTSDLAILLLCPGLT